MQRYFGQYEKRRFDTQSDDEVVEAIWRDLSVEPLEVDFDKGKETVEETSITVSEVYGSMLTVRMEVSATEGDAGVQHIMSTAEQVEHYLALQKAALEPFDLQAVAGLPLV